MVSGTILEYFEDIIRGGFREESQKYLSIFKLHPILGYHVSLSLVASLFFCISYSLFLKIIGKSRYALFGASFLLFSSSTTTLFNLFLKKKLKLGAL